MRVNPLRLIALLLCNPFLRAEVDWDSLSRCAVRIQAEKTPDDSGVGIVIEEEPGSVRVLTAKHVVEGGKRVWVYFGTDRVKPFEAHVLGQASTELDLAVVEVTSAAGHPMPGGFPPLSVGKNSRILKAEQIWTMYSDGTRVPNTVIRLNHDGDTQKFEYTRSGVDDGYSGAPIFDGEGNLVGIHQGGTGGGNFAIGVKAQSAREVMVEGLGHLASKLGGVSVRAVNVEAADKFADGRRLYANAKDADAAVAFEESASLGNMDALVSLGYLYEHGYGVSHDHAKAKELYEKAAAAGNVDAMVSLGYMYYAGRGVPQDYGEARGFYEKAAQKGSAAAMNNLGLMYDFSFGVPQDYGKAKELYERAIEAGMPEASNNLGVMYDNGHGVPRDYAKARNLYEKAAGAARSMYHLGVIYENGHGVTPDLEKARSWYQKAADGGDEEARKRLGELQK